LEDPRIILKKQKNDDESKERSTINHHNYYDNDERDATRTLFIGNLHESTRRDHLYKEFSKFGKIEEIDIKKHKSTGRQFKTFAFIRYDNMDLAINAKRSMDGKEIYHDDDTNFSSKLKIGYGNYYLFFLLLLSTRNYLFSLLFGV
jgi:RNA recognition motif-containing protein